MKISRIGTALMLALTLGLGAAACEKKEGPAEKLGAKMDKVAEDVKASAEDVKEDIKKTAEDIKEDAEH